METLMGTGQVQKKAAEALSFFEQATRTDGKKFWRMKDGVPEWVYNTAYEAHGDLLPDDYRYKFIVEALDTIAESDNPEEAEYEIETDVYTSGLMEWVASNLNRQGYVDEAMKEHGAQNFSSALMIGQAEEKREVYRIVLSALQTQVEE